MPEMRLFTYQMPDSITSIALQGEFDEFNLNEFLKRQDQKKMQSLYTKIMYKSG